MSQLNFIFQLGLAWPPPPRLWDVVSKYAIFFLAGFPYVPLRTIVSGIDVLACLATSEGQLNLNNRISLLILVCWLGNELPWLHPGWSLPNQVWSLRVWWFDILGLRHISSSNSPHHISPCLGGPSWSLPWDTVSPMRLHHQHQIWKFNLFHRLCVSSLTTFYTRLQSPHLTVDPGLTRVMS